MNSYFESRQSYNQISFRYSRGKSLTFGNEIHPYHEILYYTAGDATFLSEDYKKVLNPSTLLIIPKESYHKFHIENQDSYTRLVISFPDFPEAKTLLSQAVSKIKILEDPGEKILSILRRMQAVLQGKTVDCPAEFLFGLFISLLGEIYLDSSTHTLPEKREKEQLISRCIKYTDENFAFPLDAALIAKEMNVSESTLFHCFKKEMGISLHKYIIEKRMIHAHKLISSGENPTEVYFRCGYGDYSSFYKAYLKMFGHTPSKDKKEA